MNPVHEEQRIYAIRWGTEMHETTVTKVTPKTIRVIGVSTYARSASPDGMIAYSSHVRWYATPAEAATVAVEKLRREADRINAQADAIAAAHLGGAR